MINQIKFPELTVYNKHCTLHPDRYVLRRLFSQQTSSLLPLQVSQFALIYELPHGRASFITAHFQYFRLQYP